MPDCFLQAQLFTPSAQLQEVVSVMSVRCYDRKWKISSSGPFGRLGDTAKADIHAGLAEIGQS